MNKTQALKEAVKRWGRNAAVRDVGAKLSCTAQERAAAREALMELRGFIVTGEDRKFFKRFRESLVSQSLSERFTIGEISSGAGFRWFSVKASGDTWEECFAKGRSRSRQPNQDGRVTRLVPTLNTAQAALLKLAAERAQDTVDLMYPPDQKDIRARKLEEFTNIYYRQMVTPPR